ncbi:unnamed protein product [Lathyrus sativus]|nr:unnamed protein product [Lathyrus sativus]
MTKQGRGRPRTMVPPSPVNHPLPKNQSEVASVNLKEKERTEDHEDASDEKADRNEKEQHTPETLIAKERETETLIVKEQHEERKLWVDAINDNRNLAKGISMEYVAPKIINGEVEIEIEKEDVETKI